MSNEKISSHSDLPAMTLAEELMKTDGSRRESKYWTYGTVASSSSTSNKDLARKWGLDDSEDSGGRRQTRSSRKKGEPSVVQLEERGRLSRKLTNLNHHFNRNPEEETESQMSGELLETEERLSGELSDPEQLSGGLTAEPDGSSGKLTTGGSSLYSSGELIGTEFSSNQLESSEEPHSAKEGTPDTEEERREVEMTLTEELDFDDQTSETSTFHASEYIPGLCRGYITYPTWYDLSDEEDQLGPIPTGWVTPDEGETPPRFPEIETDEESLSDELSIRFDEIFDSINRTFNLNAVIVEVDSPESIKAESGSVDIRMEDVKKKGKKVDPAEKGPLYEKLHGKSSRKKANLKNKRTEDRPLHERLHDATKGRDTTKKSRKSVPAFVSPGPSRFRRDASEKPGGGWFRATTKKSDMESSEISSEGSGGDDTDSPPSSSDSPKGSSPSSSSSSSESSESSQANRRRHKRRRRHQRKSKKSKQKLRDIKKPFVWDGTPNLDTFDRWIYEVDTWCELVRIDDGDAVKILVQFMSGEAAKFFMKHVAMNRTKWTTKSIYEGLFDYCFPPRFKQQLRRKMVTARQGTQRNVRLEIYYGTE
ncbi:hypothetical protein M378DRAFT_13564 [Amanita muscaria Koide BX008]|uniref:Uncharacterized protein n=1 Tax=Amanita muscaria (strain Koide BX008) TaxID=946122 RepID=A0A0C2T4D0_AMAMK|nr:hypothetical protein M378DRAFT_13564 [Amanita muscaria Koide BX008]